MFYKLKIFLAAAFLFVGGLGAVLILPRPTLAAEEHTQTLEIVKYGLSPSAAGFVEEQTKNDGTPINNLPTDNNGNELVPVAGIHYIIQEIKPTSDKFVTDNPSSDTYDTVGNPYELVTDSEGIAKLSLPDGIYLLSEQANSEVGLDVPDKPVVIQLPQWNADDTAMLDTVYVYPKSSVTDTNQGSNPPTTLPPNKGSNKNSGKDKGNSVMISTGNGKSAGNTTLPKTGDDDSTHLLVSAGLVLLLGVVVLYRKFQSNRDE